MIIIINEYYIKLCLIINWIVLLFSEKYLFYLQYVNNKLYKKRSSLTLTSAYQHAKIHVKDNILI
jgi:hypothetical protein